MRGDEQRAARSFIRAARFDADEAIFDDVHAADAIGGGNFVQLIEQRKRREIFAVHRNGSAASKPISTVVGCVGRLRGRSDPLPHGFVGRVRGIFEHAAFVAQVPDVAVAAVDILLGLLDGNIVRLRVGDGFFARDDIPFAPRSDDLQFRREGFGGKLETDLIVAFAGAAVRHGIGAEFFGELAPGAWPEAGARTKCRADIYARTRLRRAAWARCSR